MNKNPMLSSAQIFDVPTLELRDVAAITGEPRKAIAAFSDLGHIEFRSEDRRRKFSGTGAFQVFVAQILRKTGGQPLQWSKPLTAILAVRARHLIDTKQLWPGKHDEMHERGEFGATLAYVSHGKDLIWAEVFEEPYPTLPECANLARPNLKPGETIADSAVCFLMADEIIAAFLDEWIKYHPADK